MPKRDIQSEPIVFDVSFAFNSTAHVAIDISEEAKNFPKEVIVGVESPMSSRSTRARRTFSSDSEYGSFMRERLKKLFTEAIENSNPVIKDMVKNAVLKGIEKAMSVQLAVSLSTAKVEVEIAKQ